LLPRTHAVASRASPAPAPLAPQGVTNLIHLSALGADPYSISEWARTKAAGEQAVRAIAPGATIVRPADIFGAEDRFLNWIAKMYVTLPRVPLVEGGMARVQPVYVDDVAQAIFKIAMVRAGCGGVLAAGLRAACRLRAALSAICGLRTRLSVFFLAAVR